MKNILKQALPYLAAVVAFYIISVGYFTPAIFQGKTLHQHDIRTGAGMGQDLGQHARENDGEKSLWSSRMFAGMPTYQITPSYQTHPVLSQLRDAFQGFLPHPANHLFSYMLGFFILLCALRINPWLAIVGAIAYGFSSYFLIIIEAGHIWKVWVLEFIPPTLAGIILAYKKKFLLGGVITAFFFALQIFSNHIQMTYYFLLLVGVFVVCRFIYDLRKKQLAPFCKASSVLLLAGILGAGVNATSLILSAKYSEQTIRGKSELTDNASNQTSGLDRDYVTQWSYGIGETFTLLIPDTKGGATGYMATNHPKEVQSAASDNNLRQFAGQQNSYWGDQPFTSGPVYVGAFILFLFIFGLFVVKGYMKWALLAGTVFSILLSWGHHCMWLTDLFLDYFPMYNKFRAVSSILIVAELCIPLLALLALAKIIETPGLIKEKRKEFTISLGLTVGLALAFLMLPSLFFHFFSDAETANFSQYLSNASYASLFDALENARIAVFRADTWRSVFVILIGVVVLWLYSAKKLNKPVTIGALAILVLFDLANVDKRYLNNEDFVPKSAAKVAWEMTAADKQILEDTDPNYRVFNIAAGPFQDASTSYFHKSIGGYHAAKLRRYQELIDRYLSKMDGSTLSVLNMLNTRYLVVPDNDGQPQVETNPSAMGNAWFADSIKIVQNADEELAALGTVDLRTTAVIDKRFAGSIDLTPAHDETDTIALTDYKINDITYKVSTQSNRLAVFSELYYDDGLSRWEAFIDGQPATPVRANYVLRALPVPAGEHTVEFIFKPKAYYVLETLSMICLVLLLLAVAGIAGWNLKKHYALERNQ